MSRDLVQVISSCLCLNHYNLYCGFIAFIYGGGLLQCLHGEGLSSSLSVITNRLVSEDQVGSGNTLLAELTTPVSWNIFIAADIKYY